MVEDLPRFNPCNGMRGKEEEEEEEVFCCFVLWKVQEMILVS